MTNLTMEEMKEKIFDRAVELSDERGINFDLTFNLKGRVAGQCNMGYGKWIKLNPSMFKDNFDSMIGQTLPHEVAHLVAWKEYGDNGHGAGWKRVMRMMGLQPVRCHDYDLSNVLKNKVYCDCRTIPVSTRMYNIVKRNPSAKMCTLCKTGVRITQ